MKDPDNILVFIHIKKTGGISLQWLLAHQYGSKFYGGYTHSALKKVAPVNPIEKNELHLLPKGSCICKHWTFDEFSCLKNRANFITIIRDPVSRIVSHYNFSRKHYPNGPGFEDYVKNPANINLYSRFMPKDLSLLTEVFSFEDLPGCIERSKLVRVNKKLPHINKTPYNYPAKEIALFKKLNKRDLKLYERLRERFI